jgi:hypothetical protein
MGVKSIDVHGGACVVELLGNGFASVLYLRGEPACLHAYDCGGSLAQLAARSTWKTIRPAELEVLRDWLADPGLHRDRRHGGVRGLRVEVLEPFTRLLASGRYVVTATMPSWGETAIVDLSGSAVASWYWPSDGAAIVTTGPWPPPDRETVDRYRRLIATGVRPAAITICANGADARYLLDGHHKLAAYQAERVRPLLIEFSPVQPVPLPRELFAALLPEPVRYQFRHALSSWRYSGPPPDGPEESPAATTPDEGESRSPEDR